MGFSATERVSEPGGISCYVFKLVAVSFRKLFPAMVINEISPEMETDEIHYMYFIVWIGMNIPVYYARRVTKIFFKYYFIL